MDILNYNYDANSHIAIADPAPPNNVLRVYSVSYPMLAKSVSKEGVESPTGNSTNILIVTRESNEVMEVDVTVELAEGFPTTASLVSNINQAIIEAFPNVVDPLKMVLVGESQVRWVNNEAFDWLIRYPNLETKQLIKGEYEGLLNETVLANSKSELFECDSRLGLSQLVIKLTNGQSLSVSSAGKWLDHNMFSFHTAPTVDFTANREVRIIGHYNSLRITKELYSPRRDGIIISTN